MVRVKNSIKQRYDMLPPTLSRVMRKIELEKQTGVAEILVEEKDETKES